MKALVFAFFLLFSPLYGKKKSVSLEQLLAGKYFRLQLISTGAHQENCLQLIVRYTGPDSLELRLQPGLRFNSLNDQEQDLLLTASPTLHLGKGVETRLMLRAFCCQASLRGPAIGGRYELAAKQDSSLKQLASYLFRRAYSTAITQQAIWVLSDGKPLAGIPDTSENLQSLRVLLAHLGGQKIPWYQLDYVSGQWRSGQLYQYPERLRARILLNNAQDDYVTLTVINSAGLPCGKILRHWLKPGLQQPYDLDIPLAGLTPGNYAVILQGKESVLYRGEFEV